MLKIKRSLKKFIIANIVFVTCYFFSRYFPGFVVPVFSGVTSFLLLKIIHSEFFNFYFHEKKILLSLIKFLFLLFLPFKKAFGQKIGGYLFSFFVPCSFLL